MRCSVNSFGGIKVWISISIHEINLDLDLVNS